MGAPGIVDIPASCGPSGSHAALARACGPSGRKASSTLKPPTLPYPSPFEPSPGRADGSPAHVLALGGPTPHARAFALLAAFYGLLRCVRFLTFVRVHETAIFPRAKASRSRSLLFSCCFLPVAFFVFSVLYFEHGQLRPFNQEKPTCRRTSSWAISGSPRFQCNK